MLWKNYFFTVDFSEEAEFFKRFDEGDTLTGQDAETMAGIFQERDPHPSKQDRWNVNPEHDYSLMDAKVVYHGINTDLMCTNAKFNRVLVLDFEPTDCDQPDGRVYLQYNV